MTIAKQMKRIRDGPKLQQEEAGKGRNDGNRTEKQIASFQIAVLVNTGAGAVGSREVLQNNRCVSVSEPKILSMSLESEECVLNTWFKHVLSLCSLRLF